MIAHDHNHTQAGGNVKNHGFNPYQNNEGTVLGKSIFILLDLLTKNL
jgi:hypothetical protein